MFINKEHIMKKNTGFTLIEVLVVVLIVGTLATVALPQYERAVMRSRASEIWAILPTVRSAAQEYCLANGGTYGNIPVEDLSVSFPSHMKTTAFSCSSCWSFASGHGQVSGALLLNGKKVDDNITSEDFVQLTLGQNGSRSCEGTKSNCKKLGFSKGDVYCSSGGCSNTGSFTE